MLTIAAGSVGSASAFAVKRDRKFLSHTGNEDALPRYVTLDTSVRHITTAAAAVQSLPPVPVSKPAKMLSDIAEKAVKALAFVEEKSSAVAEVAAGDDAELTCATGTCSFRPRDAATIPVTGSLFVC